MKLRYEPVVILDLVKYVLVALTALGVVTIDGAAQDWIIAIIGGALTLVSTVATRSRVIPAAKYPASR